MEEIAQQSKVSRLIQKISATANCLRGKLPELDAHKIIYLFIPILAIIVSGIVLLNLKHVTIEMAGKTVSIATFSNNPSKILNDNNILTSKYDKVSFSGFNKNYATIKILPAFTVNVSADKSTKSVQIADGTVKDVLERLGITVGSEDILSTPLDSKVFADETITIKRVTYDKKVTYKEIPYTTTKEETASLVKGTTKVLTAGKAGKKAVIAKVKFIDGVEQGSVTVNEETTENPVTEHLLVGTASSRPYSSLTPPSSLKLNANGVPVSFSRSYTGTATAYSAREGAKTASGRTTRVGYVAVDPNKIPYGTKLYIMSPDGSFVYGYAIAADTGLFAANGSGILTDLFFDSNATCRRFGMKTVTIYVLK